MLLVFELETLEEFVVWLGAGSLLALAIVKDGYSLFSGL